MENWATEWDRSTDMNGNIKTWSFIQCEQDYYSTTTSVCQAEKSQREIRRLSASASEDVWNCNCSRARIWLGFVLSFITMTVLSSSTIINSCKWCVGSTARFIAAKISVTLFDPYLFGPLHHFWLWRKFSFFCSKTKQGVLLKDFFPAPPLSEHSV